MTSPSRRESTLTGIGEDNRNRTPSIRKTKPARRVSNHEFTHFGRGYADCDEPDGLIANQSCFVGPPRSKAERPYAKAWLRTELT